MREAAKQYSWKLNYGSVALMWRGGCIIRRYSFLLNNKFYFCLLKVYFWEILNQHMIKMKHWKIYFWMSFLQMLLINVNLVGEKL